MFTDIKTNRKKQAAIAALFVLILGAAGYWGYTYLTKPEEKPKSPIELTYCGAEPKQICISSFGRDLDGNTVINFYIPNRKMADFSLLVKREKTESVFECHHVTEVQTSRYCVGANIPLNSVVEIQVIAATDQHVIGKGEFKVASVLVAAYNTPTQEVAANGTPATDIAGQPQTPSANEQNSGGGNNNNNGNGKSTPVAGNSSGGGTTTGGGNEPGTTSTPEPTDGTPSYPGPSYP